MSGEVNEEFKISHNPRDRFKYFENTLNPRAIHVKKDEIRSGYHTRTGVAGALVTVTLLSNKRGSKQ